MPRRLWILVVCLVGLAAGEATAAEAVIPRGPGVLTKCRDWLITRSCHRYHHIRLPSRVAVGDTIKVSFGSSRKEFDFPVVRIALQGDRCTLFSEPDGDRPPGDKIEVASCSPAKAGAGVR